MKHLETKLLWIKKAVANKVMKLQHVPTKEQLADIFTKALAPVVFIYLISQFMYYVQHWISIDFIATFFDLLTEFFKV